MTTGIKGLVRAFTSSGEEIPTRHLFTKSNLIVNQSADAMAAMANQFGGFSISHVYFEFASEASSFDDPAPEDSIDSVVTSATSPRDLLRCRMLTPPGVSSSDENLFSGNELSFLASTATAKPQGGVRKGFVNATDFSDGCLVGGACLVASSGEQGSDFLFARIKFDDPVEKIAEFDIDLQWVITFPEP